MATALWGIAARLFRKRSTGPAAGAITFALIAAAAILATATILLVANSIRPFLVPRYLIAMAPFSAALLAALSAEVIMRHRWLVLLSLLASVTAIGLSFARQARVGQWNATATPIGEIVRRCPGTVVHVRPRWVIPQDNPPQMIMANEARVVRFGHEYVAARAGFVIEPERSAQIAANCPTLLWIEQHLPESPAKLAGWAGLPLSADQIARSRMIVGETGFVVIYPAPRGS
ncbi:hypothetical protein G4G27_09100 [Sphingomonas sp. So64.6b]|nr:hypothetical protein G4G27_09100 [Sphingomonas sp. So64.6b]